MNNAASFNLLKFIEQRPWLNFNKIVTMIIIYVIGIASYTVFQLNQLHSAEESTTKMQLVIQQSVKTLQPLVEPKQGDPMVAVLSSGSLKNHPGFYPEFEALTHIRIQGLWLNNVVIQRTPPFIKIAGAMDSPDKLSQLLKQLSAQPVFENVRFVGVNVTTGLVPFIPKQYQKELQRLKVPMYYHFILQTTPLNSSGVTAR